jgi:hypothetical protein
MNKLMLMEEFKNVTEQVSHLALLEALKEGQTSEAELEKWSFLIEQVGLVD